MPNKKDTVSGVSFVMHRIWKFICQPQFPYRNPSDFFPLWVAAREDNTLSSRLTRPLHFPFVPFLCFDWCSHLAWELPRLPNKKDTVSGVFFRTQRNPACNKKSLFRGTEYGHLSASRNFLLEILRISFLYGLRLAKTILCLRASPGLCISLCILYLFLAIWSSGLGVTKIAK